MLCMITVAQAIRDKKREFKNVTALLDSIARDTAKTLHKRFVDAGGCEKCWGTNLGDGGITGYCTHCSSKTVKTGIDPNIPRECWCELADEEWSKTKQGAWQFVNPLFNDDAFVAMTRDLFVTRKQLSKELWELDKLKKVLVGDYVVVSTKSGRHACNQTSNPRCGSDLAYVECGTVLEVYLREHSWSRWLCSSYRKVTAKTYRTLDKKHSVVLYARDVKKLHNFVP